MGLQEGSKLPEGTLVGFEPGRERFQFLYQRSAEAAAEFLTEVFEDFVLAHHDLACPDGTGDADK